MNTKDYQYGQLTTIGAGDVQLVSMDILLYYERNVSRFQKIMKWLVYAQCAHQRF